jgi:hypothetical protein
MREKISVALSKDLLAQIERLAGSKNSRSAFIERILRKYIFESATGCTTCPRLSTYQSGRINRAAVRLNLEAADVRRYQAGE